MDDTVYKVICAIRKPGIRSSRTFVMRSRSGKIKSYADTYHSITTCCIRSKSTLRFGRR